MRGAPDQTETLLTSTLRIYSDFKRGVDQSPHEAAIVRSMQNHKEWWQDWEAFDRGVGVEDSATTARLLHIHHDARVLMEVEQSDPHEIRAFYEVLREKGFTEFESVHTIALGLIEEFADARENKRDFSPARYVERSRIYTRLCLSRPHKPRIAGLRA